MTVWQRFSARLGVHRMMRLINLYPPYLGAGIRVRSVAPDMRTIDVTMELRGWNQNYVGTHFGGSLYSMCDPFFMIMVLSNLGDAYVVWDKSATIDFLAPGRGTVRARFEIDDAALARIRDDLAVRGKSHPTFEAIVRDAADRPIARVTKTLSVRPKKG